MLPDVREEMSQRELCMTAMTIWQIGGTRRVCKETFLEIPHHENFLQMDEGEDTYIQCSGTIVVNNVEFVIEPLVLVFDLSEPLSKEINDLRAFPTSVVIRDAKYCLAGITVFIEKKSHHAGYIFHQTSNTSYLYDGLRASCFSEVKDMKIKGLPSLCVYFLNRPERKEGKELINVFIF